MPRPLLSGESARVTCPLRDGVAGVYAPAFVERDCIQIIVFEICGGVAGVYAPAFVERRLVCTGFGGCLVVSLGFMPRPLLSGVCV